ncbi:TolC family protein [Neotamlana laminarinivorans]|uniref:TolC family protein n=1 Tax=Neotamlana laminarinivorans TaxID=2883124 RepID=A0A9X1HYI1_9FLAO|nr:TolC family protein [Tamlana laminarinivorans]MCB4798469.1 TolC family protein [Tamlana laminarinivorans]
MKNNLITIIGFLFCVLLNAQENSSHSFSLQEAIDYAKENNRTIKNADLSILAAKQDVKATTALGLPQINGAVDYSTNLKTPFDDLEVDPDDPSNIIPFLYPKHQLTPAIQLNQLLFDGGYIVGLQSNKVFLEISKNAKDKTVNQIETAVISAYNNALLTKESIVITQNNITVLKDNLNETTKIFENGLTEEEDVEQLQITLSSLEINLKNIETLHEISKGYLKVLLGLNPNDTITLTSDLETLVTENISLNLISDNHDITNNIDYKISTNEVTSKELEYKLQKAEQLPKLNAFVNASYLGNNENFGDFFKKEQEWYFFSGAGVSLTVPIFSSFGNKAKRQKAKIEWEIAQNNLLEQQNQLNVDVQNAKNEYNLAIETYANKQKNLTLAEKIERKNTIKYREGIASSFDLRQAQTQLYTIQQEYLQSIIDVINKKAELKNLLNLK